MKGGRSDGAIYGGASGSGNSISLSARICDGGRSCSGCGKVLRLSGQSTREMEKEEERRCC